MVSIAVQHQIYFDMHETAVFGFSILWIRCLPLMVTAFSHILWIIMKLPKTKIIFAVFSQI